MRILTFLHSFEPGGVERVALRLVARWRTMGLDAPLFMGRECGALRDELATEMDYFVPPQPRLGSGWWETLWMIARLPGHVRRVRPDLLFCAGNTYTIVAVAMKLLLGRRCPPIVAKLSNDLVRADLPVPARALWRGWLRIQARVVDRWIVMDTSILADVATHLGAVDTSVISDPAIDRLPPPRPAPPARSGTRYVAVGRLVHQKDHATMLAAFAEVGSSSDRLMIIGDGPLRAALMRQVTRLGIEDRVVFAGHVPNAAAAMREHDILLLSSRYEGVPAVLVEALAAGLRVVATDCGPGVRALLGIEGAEHLPPAGNPSAFAAAIARGPRRTGDAEVNRRRMQAFTLETAAPRYLDAFTQTIESYGRRVPVMQAVQLERTV
ncbi:glycosyltransferase [Sphingomonas sp. S-NIH.Pt1_0416]|uniref:glycosyltransferase n=1 Tax=Sphingomonas sp. S-NIH.Pt1_0416 TaxID=1920123 RepID=UPI000F7E7E61|nr:glycosyltransferase [Sphingomonas sp. S-NIH.Pt1_0416]RSU65269.1 glycosyltransferase [Sphingomonas sp. S-NIH.Pt1_0416]